MGSRALPLLTTMSSSAPLLNISNFKSGLFSKALTPQKVAVRRSYFVRSGLEPPNLSCLAETARITLTQDENEEFAPKIQQVVDWFGQLQAVDLHSVQPSIRAGNK